MTTEEIDNLEAEQLQTLFELYKQACGQTDTTATLGDFDVWMQER